MPLVPFLYDRLHDLREQNERGYTFLTGPQESLRRSFAELCLEAERIAGALSQRGVRPGDRVGILVGDNHRFIVTFMACVHGGFVAVPLSPPPALGRADSFLARIRAIADQAHLSLLVFGSEQGDMAGAARGEGIGGPRAESFDVLERDGQPHRPAELDPSDVCFIQYTSGSTGTPKGVVVDYHALAVNCGALGIEGLGLTASDVGVSWLPLYHDMGLVGKVLTSLATATPVVFIPTRLFVRHPSIWMQTMSDFRGTITFAPNFAFAVAARRFRPSTPVPDLSCVRAIGCGSEPVQAETLRAFQRCYGPFGLSENAIVPSYGMAEATLAVSFGGLDRPFVALSVSKQRLGQGRVERATAPDDVVELVSCGAPFSGHDVTVEDGEGAALPEDVVGELVVQGPSVAQGYYRDDAMTRQTFGQGRLHTGDLGFLHDGEIYICGRLKDVIIVHGVNHYPQDLEWSLATLEGLRDGSVVAIGVDSGAGEQVVIVAERAGQHDVDALRGSIRDRLREACGLVPADIVLLAPGTLPKTTSGKLQRSETRRRYLNGQLERPKASPSS